MKYYGVRLFDFTPNLTVDHVDFGSPLPVNWKEKLRVRRVYSQKAVCRYKRHESFDKSGWADPNVNVPSWYTIYDAAYMTPLIDYTCTCGTNCDSHYYGYQIHFVFDTSFIGENSLVVAATLTCTTRGHYIPYNYNLCGTGVYCNFYVSSAEYIHTRHQGMPVNVPADGSGYAARFGPYPNRNPNYATPRWDGQNSYDTAVLHPDAINKVGLTTLTGLTSDFLTMNAGTNRFIFYRVNCAWITVYYAAL